MKNSKYFLLLLIFSTVFFPAVSFGQPDADAFLDKCSANLGTYNYIKSFVIDTKSKKKENSEYSYVFSKGSKYILIVCNDNGSTGEMHVNLYDRNHDLIGSTYDESTNKLYPELIYTCSATGVYYIKPVFKGAKRSRGICILGFSKEN
jgi:hypothetical protein